MRRSLLFFLIAVSIFSLNILPTFASADTSITGKTDCPAGSASTDPTGQQTFSASADSAKNIQAYVYKAESCASACFDENVSVQVGISLSPTVTVAVKATNQCGTTPLTQPTKAQPPRGCSASQKQPQITLQVPDVSLLGTTYMKEQTIGPKSRCYGAVANTISSLSQGGISSMSNPTAIQSSFDSLSALGTQAPAVQTTGAVAGNDQLIAALTSSGIAAGDAQKLAGDPVSAQALINAYATGNKDTIQDTIQDAADRNGVKLNDDVYDNVASLSASNLDTAKAALSPLADQSGTTVVGSTFDTSDSSGTNASNISSALSPLCNQLGGCGNVCATSNTMVCKTNNPGALTWASWEAKYGGQPCGQANNTACFPTMEQGIQAQARLLTTSNAYFASGTNTIWGEFCESNYASGPGSNCASYANFVSQQTGIPVNQTIDPNNAQQIGAIMMAQSRMESGKGVIFTTDQLQTGLGLAYGTQTLPTGTPGFVASTANTNVGGLGGTFSGGNTSGQVMLSSPFANVSPIYSTPGLGSASAYPIAYSQPTIAQYPVASAPVTQPLISTGTSVSGVQAGQNGTPVAQIIAQPQVVHIGGLITLAWSSVGMSVSSPCQVLENGSVIGNASNQGSQIITASTTGKISFSMSCTAQATGVAITGSATVLVQ